MRFTTKSDAALRVHHGLAGEVGSWIKASLADLEPTSSPPKIRNVELLGYKDKVIWTQDEQGLTVVMPEQKPCEYAITLKIV